MKTGIFTFHRSRNYGAVLQAYGLVETLKNLGNEVYVVDYRCAKIEDDLTRIGKGSNPLKKMARKIFAMIKEYNFSSFNRKYLNMISYTNFKKSDFQIEISGSDQVWNNAITGNDKIFFGEDFKGRKVAYAASCGDDIHLENSDYELIEQYDFVSVREPVLQTDLKNNGLQSVVVPDPTILAGRKSFDMIASERILKEPYAFVYMIWESKALIALAQKYADSKGLKLITNKNCKEFFFHSSPTDFLAWIKYAEVVFTNSFHGTVFSLLFGKMFMSSIVKPKGNKNTRVLQLLERVGCCENIISDENRYVTDVPEINDCKVQASLFEMQKAGIDFLTRATE